jgi:uncharacterized protein (DUF362 family)
MADQQDNLENKDRGPTQVSRREFLRGSAVSAAALAATGSILAAAAQLLGQTPPAAKSATPMAKLGAVESGAAAPAGEKVPPAKAAAVQKSRVVVVTHPEVIVREYQANRAALEKMIERAVRELAGPVSAQKAWQALATDADRVSMKVTRAAGPTLCTHSEIGDYLARRLAEVCHVESGKIRIWDRSDLNDSELELSEPYTLPSRQIQTRLRAALVKDVTCIINLPVMKMHTGTGTSLALKNHFGSINNPSALHGWERGEMWKSIAELNALEPIRTRTRLVLCDATRPLYNDGPEDNPKYRWTFGGIVAGRDPVAVESVCLDILEKKREEVHGSPWPCTDGRKVVAWAQKIGLGQADKSKIDLVTVALD